MKKLFFVVVVLCLNTAEAVDNVIVNVVRANKETEESLNTAEAVDNVIYCGGMNPVQCNASQYRRSSRQCNLFRNFGCCYGY